MTRPGGLADYAAAAAAQPDNPDAQAFLGNALMEEGRPAEAAECYRIALRLRPAHAPTWYNLGNAHLALDDAVEAERCLRESLALNPRQAATHNNLGNALRRQGRHAEAAACFRAALALRPDSAGTLNNLGSVLIALREPEAALAPLHEALRLQPDYAEACNNLGGAMLALDRLDEAIPWFDRALASDPDHAQAAFGRAMALLAMGDLPAGFAAYEARWRDPHFCAGEPSRDAPLWHGQPCAGQTILVHAEQGLGDTLQFVRYLPLLRARAGHVLLEVQAPLVTLCAPLADVVFASGATPPPHALRCPLLSLPHRFATDLATIPCVVPYVSATPRWPIRGPGRNIGIAFSGSPDHAEDDLRSIPALLWRGVLSQAATFHLLQPVLRAADEVALASLPTLVHHALPDMQATADIIATLDLVIAVDTAVAHLAGALARPVWILLQASADFRWLRGRDDSPWYPTARLFRQGPARDWAPVMARVAAALDAFSPVAISTGKRTPV